MACKSARLGDIGSAHGCFPATPVMTGSPDVLINSRPAIRAGDALVPHGCSDCSSHPRSVAAGAATVFINGRPAARVGDPVDCGGRIASGSSNVFVGDAPKNVNPVPAEEWAAFMQAVLRRENRHASGYERQQLAAAKAVEYRGTAGGIASWQAYYQSERRKGAALPAPRQLTDPLEHAGLVHALKPAAAADERPPDWIQQGIPRGTINPDRPEAVTSQLFHEGAKDDLNRETFALSSGQAATLTESVEAIADAGNRARVIRAIYTRVNAADPFAAWFALAPMAADQVVNGLWYASAGSGAALSTIDEAAEIVERGLAEGNMAVFKSQFMAYARYRNGGVEAVRRYAEQDLGQRSDLYSDLVSGYSRQDSSMAAARMGNRQASRTDYALSLKELAAYEQGDGVLQSIYEKQYTVPYRASGIAARQRAITGTFGEELESLRDTASLFGLSMSTTNIVGTPHTFGGDNIADYDQRMNWINDMADSLVEARFEQGHEAVVEFNQGLLAE